MATGNVRGSMDFRIIPMRDFGRQELAEWPVWSEYQDPEELEELVAWGVDVTSFHDRFRALNLGNEHAVYPVLKYDPLPDDRLLYLLANFRTRSGHTFDGYLVTENPNCVGVFVGSEEILFNVNLRDLADADIGKVARYLGVTPDDLFPLTYTTGFRLSDGTLVAGTFDFR